MSKNVHNQNLAEQAHSLDKTKFGFWVYLMTDCVIFATLFATYAIVRHNTAGGPSGKELFDLQFVLAETLLLLTSSFTAGLLMLAARQKDAQNIVTWLLVTLLLGGAFVGMELFEFREMLHEGHGWSASAFLSAYFTLVGTHGLHILIGLLWGTVLLWRLATHGLEDMTLRRLGLFGLFWHFLDIVWIFIFSFVYLIGAL